MDLWHLNNLEIILTLWTLNYVDCVSFSCISIFLLIEPTNLKKSYSRISEKHLQTSISLTDVFDFIGCFSNYVAFKEIKWLCVFTKFTAKKYNKATIYVNKLILAPFSPFDIKCKKLDAQSLWICVFRALRLHWTGSNAENFFEWR